MSVTVVFIGSNSGLWSEAESGSVGSEPGVKQLDTDANTDALTDTDTDTDTHADT